MAQSPSANAKKSAARLLAVQALYQAALNEQALEAVAEEYITHRIGMRVEDEDLVPADKILFLKIVRGVAERKEDVGAIIQASTAREGGAPFEPLIKAILMCGGYELLVHSDVEAGIIINDYLNVAHAFFEKGEVSLINGILDRVGKASRD